MPDSDVRKLVGKKKWDELLESDQVTFNSGCISGLNKIETRSTASDSYLMHIVANQ